MDTLMATPTDDRIADTTRTVEEMGRDAVARTEAQVIGTSPIEQTALEREEELFTVNMGPHHPATHGVLRLLVSLEGEVVRDLKPVMGYVHTGIEKSCEQHSYWKVIPFVERMDYLSYYFNAEAFCGAVERLLELEIPPRAKWLRTMHLELNRISSHLVGLGTTALDLGAISMFWYCFRERDKILDLMEMSSGQRMHTRYFQVGGVIEDIPLGFEEKVRAFTDEMPERINQYAALLDRNEIFLQRTKGTGMVSRERLLELGVTGPLLRAAGEPWDLRKVEPYLAYDEVEFDIPVGTTGDNYDRYKVRLQEMRESVRIVEQCLDGLPEGPWIADDRKVVLPPRHELGTSMEALIHHFKLVTEGYRVPPGESYYPIESPRGELGCFVVADGSAKPSRVHMREPSFVNLQALRDMCIDGYVADMICNLAMLDPILGGIDR
ncbi:MAG TPA: NADH dehydrogenase (quinone) subunit D [Solirubrobacterales bacterium]|nr:NADH dehydrogenase (quinone) subunit D [Solirubrobacterales bacterium]